MSSPADPSPRPHAPTDPIAPARGDAVAIVAWEHPWVVVEKPAGLLSVPGRGPDKSDCVTARVAAMFPAASGPLNVHRLDMETSGLMVFALDRPAHAELSRQFMHRETGKRYTALLAGDIAEDEGRVDLPLIVDWPNRPRQIVCRERGKPATTHWRVLERTPGRTRVELSPATGRTHQLRVHAAAPRDQGGMSAPILGDVLYGAGASAPRLMLHATYLAFRKPGAEDRLEFWSVPPF